MHVELTEKELLSCGLPMYVCSLHEKKNVRVVCAPCDSDLGVRSSGDWTVSTSNSCCCPLQLLRVVAHWVAMRSWSLVRLNTSLERSVEPPLASSTKRKFCRGLITPKLQLQEKQHAHLLGDLPLARSWSLALQARWSSYRLSSLSLLAANSSGCLFGKRAHSPGFVPVWCLPEQESLESDEPPGSCCHCSAGQPYAYAVGVSPDWCSPASLLPLVTRKVNCSRSLKKLTANISSTCALQYVTAYAVSAPLPLSFRTFTYARTVARASIDLGVQRRETADKCEQTTDTTVL